MSVDLLEDLHPTHSPGCCTIHSGGDIVFRNGEALYSLYVGPDEDGEIEVRIEHGLYKGYTRDGLKCDIQYVDGRKRWVRLPDAGQSPWDIVEFKRRK